MQGCRHILFQDGIVAAVDRFFADLKGQRRLGGGQKEKKVRVSRDRKVKTVGKEMRVIILL